MRGRGLRRPPRSGWDASGARWPAFTGPVFGYPASTIRPSTRILAAVAVALELVELPLFALAFGAPLAGLLAVRTVLAVVLAVFAGRGQPVARAVLGALRLLAATVAIGMAPLVESGPMLVAALAAAGLGDALVGLTLLMRRTS
jgi:hypothetical protein